MFFHQFSSLPLASKSRSRRGSFAGGRKRRRGISLWLFVASLPVIVGMCGLVIDMGQLYARRAQAQRAADAAALAGASVSGDSNSNDKVVAAATHYAAANGFDPDSTRRPAKVRVVPQFAGSSGTGFDNTVYVSVAIQEPVYFVPILETLLNAMGKSQDAATFSRTVSASARAQKIVHFPLSLGGPYGIADPNVSPANLSVFGPEAYHSYGDPYSTQFNNNGTVNPLYDACNGTDTFSMNVSAGYIASSPDKLVHLQLYDPECYSPTGSDSFDEIRSPNPLNQHDASHPNLHSQDATTTRYEVWKDGKLIPGASATYGTDPASNNKWVEPSGFAIDTSVYGAGDYQIRVKAIDGSSENGFLMRAGPTAGLGLTDTDWNNQYGDKMGTNPNNVAVPIAAKDHLQMNFTRSGVATFQLGYVPAAQAGKSFGVSKFDVDVGSTDLVYTCDSLPGQTFPGVLPNPGNDVWSVDTIPLPADYKGGNWKATYTAGAGDTSNWSLLGQSGGDGQVRLTE